MPIAASTVSRERISCPSCGAPSEHMGDACPSCGYTAATAVEKFNFEAPPLGNILDVEGLIPATGNGAIEAKIATIQARFPQFRFSACVLRLAPGTNVCEFGHWLLNASPLNPGEGDIDRRRLLLLILDVENLQASITMGYDIEPYIGETPARHALEAVQPAIAQGDLEHGIVGFLDGIEAQLERAFEYVEQKLKRGRA